MLSCFEAIPRPAQGKEGVWFVGELVCVEGCMIWGKGVYCLVRVDGFGAPNDKARDPAQLCAADKASRRAACLLLTRAPFRLHI